MTQLRVLFVDDSEDDAMLVARELRRGGYELTSRQVCSAAAVREAFASPWDVVISDWSMPDAFTGLRAFEIMRELGHDLPFIIVSGTIGEDIAVDALHAGVHDFMTKGKFARLIPTIERELREVGVRRRERDAELQLAAQRNELERSERLLREVLGAVPDGVVVVDAKGQVRTSNAAAVRLLGATGSELATWIRQQAPIALALRGVSVDREEIVVRLENGKRRWLKVSTRPLRDESGIHGALAVMLDMTREKDSQEQLMISDRMASIGMLAAGVAHELNNPLASVLANVQLAGSLVDDLACNETTRELADMLDDARTAGDRVRQIVRDLRIFARHEDTPCGAVDLRATLESTTRMAWNEIRHRARLVQNYAETPLVRGSESRLGQVFLNLIVNAAQAIGEGNATEHTIRIATSIADNGDVVVEVSDTGTGMSAETQRQLFTPFFTTKPQGEGTGLGLTISHRIVTSLGGTIRVDSTEGQGTSFFVTLPCATLAEPRGRTPSRLPNSQGRRILVIDDESMITTTLGRLLREHEVRTSNDAREALGWLRDGERFDAILCDLMMPDMTGMEFHGQLDALVPQQAAQVIFMTGEAFTVAARSFLDEVPNDRIGKPFDIQELRRLLCQ